MASKFSRKSGRYSTAKEKDIKRINERRAQIARDVAKGKLPKNALDRFENAIRSIAGAFLNRSGNISHGKAAQEALSQEDLNALLQRSSSRSLQREIKEQVAQEYDKSVKEVTMAEIQGYMSDVDYVNNKIDEDSDRAYDAFDAAFHGVKGRKTYAQLRQALEAYATDTDQGEINPFSAQEVYFT